MSKIELKKPSNYIDLSHTSPVSSDETRDTVKQTRKRPLAFYSPRVSLESQQKCWYILRPEAAGSFCLILMTIVILTHATNAIQENVKTIIGRDN